MIRFLVCILSMIFLVGCQNLIDKSVSVDNSVEGFKAILGVDPVSGTITPTVAFGFGSSLFLTIPMNQDKNYKYTKKSQSLFGKLFGISVEDSITVEVTSVPDRATVRTKLSDGVEIITDYYKDRIDFRYDNSKNKIEFP